MTNIIMCRMCANSQTQNLHKLFDAKHRKILKQFKALTGKTLKYEEKLPQHICQCCQNNLTRACEFRAMLLTVQHYYTTSQYLDTLQIPESKLDKNHRVVKNIEISKIFKADIDEEYEDEENKDEQKEQISLDLKEEECHILNSFKTAEEVTASMENEQMIITDGVIKVDDSQTVVSRLEYKEQDCETQDLNNDLLQEEKKEQPDSYICSICGKTFRTRKYLMKHYKRHMPKTDEDKNKNLETMICDICGKIFKSRRHLRWHYRRHVGEKRYQCGFCEYKCLTGECLQNHVRTHTGERPYHCKYCDRRFALLKTLRRHIKNHDTVRSHACTYCDKSFAEAYNLRAHLVSHTGISRFNCDLCKKVFSCKALLVKHYESKGHLQNSASQELSNASS